MPRYYFDLVDDKTVFDHKGIVLPDATEARKFATTFARELVETKQELLGESAFAWSVQVSNGRFEKVLSIPLSLAAGTEPESSK
jgi:hypothetical protein